jgi:hypothetical protein
MPSKWPSDAASLKPALAVSELFAGPDMKVTLIIETAMNIAENIRYLIKHLLKKKLVAFLR